MAESRKRTARTASKGRGTSHAQIPAALQKTEAQYREFFENANDGLALFTLEGILVLVNRGAERLLGWSRKELIGQHYRKLVTPAAAALADERTQRFLAGEKLPSIFESELVCKDGRVIPVEARTQVIRDRKGNALGFQGSYRDITERRHAEVALRESEERYRGLVELCPDAIVVHVDEKFVYVNPAGLDLLGAERPEALIGKSIWDFVPPDYRAVVTERLGQIATEGQSGPLMEQKLLRLDGQEIDVEISGTGVSYGGKQAVQVVVRDITQRRQMEGARRESEAKYRTIFSASPDLIYLTDAEGRLLDANPAVLERARLSLEDLKQMHFMDFFAGENREELLQAFGDLVGNKRAKTGLEVQAKNPQGDVFEYEVNASPLLEGDQVTQVLSLARDITERKQTEREVQAARHVRERIADTIPDVLYLYDLTAQALVYVNRQLFTVLGYPPEELQAYNASQLRTLVHPDDCGRLTGRDARLATVADGEVVETEYRFKHASGEWRSLLARETIFLRAPDGTPTQVLGVAQDVTERRRLEDLLKERVLDKQDMPARLREFRRTLRVSQAEFGKTFGGYSQSQISAYEQGEVDISLGLILAIRAQGYPIEAVLGSGKNSIIDETVTYLPAYYQAKVLAHDLVAVALQLLEQDRQTVEGILQGLGLPVKHFSAEQQKLLAQLLNRIKGSD